MISRRFERRRRSKSRRRPPKPDSVATSLVGTLIVYGVLFALISGGLSVASNVLAGNAKDFFQNTDMTSASNYSPSGTPTNNDDVRITRTSTTALRITADTA